MPSNVHLSCSLISAMTTAYARIRLYNVLDHYSDSIAYMDTDSLVALIPPSMSPPPCSGALGALKDEIVSDYGPGAEITAFSSIASKSYEYELSDEWR